MIQELQDTWHEKEQQLRHQLEQQELTSQDLHVSVMGDVEVM